MKDDDKRLTPNGNGADVEPEEKVASEAVPQTCTLCGRSRPDTGVLIVFPNGPSICSHCVDNMRDMIGYERMKAKYAETL